MNDLSPSTVLCVGAHPDDIDFGASGSVAKWASQGAAVYYLILTDGSKGTSDRTIDGSDLRDTRRSEQTTAARRIGVSECYFLDYEDGALENTRDVKRDIVRHIRQLKPDTVVTFDPGMLYDAERGFINHPDHRAAGQATLDAVYPLARDHLSFPELLKTENLEPHKVAHVLLFNFTNATYCEDISGFIDAKMESVAAHVSQMSQLESIQSMLRNVAKKAAAGTDYEYCESFVRIDTEA